MNEPQAPNSSSNSEANEQLAEQWLRISELQNRVRELNGGDFFHETSCTDPNLMEAIWRSILDSMETPSASISRQLVAQGFCVPKISEVSEKETCEELSRLIRALAKLDIYLCGTDRFSDRDLLQVLIEHILPSETRDQSKEDRCCVVIDLKFFSSPEFPNEYDIEEGGGAEWEVELDPETLYARRPQNRGKGRDKRLPRPPKGRQVVLEGY